MHVGVHPGYQARKDLQTRTLKIDPHKCFDLKYPYNSYLFEIYQRHYFYALYIKQKNWKCIGFFQATKLTTTDKMTSVTKSCISKSVKK